MDCESNFALNDEGCGNAGEGICCNSFCDLLTELFMAAFLQKLCRGEYKQTLGINFQTDMVALPMASFRK